MATSKLSSVSWPGDYNALSGVGEGVSTPQVVGFDPADANPAGDPMTFSGFLADDLGQDALVAPMGDLGAGPLGENAIAPLNSSLSGQVDLGPAPASGGGAAPAIAETSSDGGQPILGGGNFASAARPSSAAPEAATPAVVSVDQVSSTPPASSGPVLTPLDENAATASANTGPIPITTGSSTNFTVSTPRSGLVFNNTIVGTYPGSTLTAFDNDVVLAEEALEKEATNSITIKVVLDGTSQGPNGDGAENSFDLYGFSYGSLRSALQAQEGKAGNTYGNIAALNLPATSVYNGDTFYLPTSYARMLGLTNVSGGVGIDANGNIVSGSFDDAVILNTYYVSDYGQDAVNALMHELSEGGLGRIGGLGDAFGSGNYSTMDLFRYNGSGQLDDSDGRDGKQVYFSYNGGQTNSGAAGLYFNNEFNTSGQQVNGADVADWGLSDSTADVFGDVSSVAGLSQTDDEILGALGWVPLASAAPPTVTSSNPTVTNGQSVPLGNIFTVSSSQPVTQYQVWFSDAPAGDPPFGEVTNNGTPIALDQWVTVSSLSGLDYIGSATPGTDYLWLKAYNGQWSATFQSIIADQGIAAPTVTSSNPTVTNGQSVPLGNIFTVSSSQPVTQYQVWLSDAPAGDPPFGEVTNNGTPIALDQWVTVSSLSGLDYIGSATPGSDYLWLKAYNGQWNSPSAQAIITDQGIAAPTVTSSNPTVTNGQSVPLGNIFTVSSSQPVTQYQVWFSDAPAGDPPFGEVTNNGTPIALDQWVTVSSLSGLDYIGSATPGTDYLWLKAYNGQWSATFQSIIADQGIAAPTVTSSNPTVTNGQSVPLGNIFTVSSSQPVTQYQVWFSDAPAGDPPFGEVTNNGTPIALDQWVTVSSLSGLDYIGSATPGTDYLWLKAYNGQWSATFQSIIADQGIAAPTVTSSNPTVTNGQSVPLGNIFTVSSSQPVTQYQVWFSDAPAGDPPFGEVTNNGTPIALDQWVTVSSLSGLDYIGSATPGSDYLWLKAYNGQWSATFQSIIADQGIAAGDAPARVSSTTTHTGEFGAMVQGSLSASDTVVGFEEGNTDRGSLTIDPAKNAVAYSGLVDGGQDTPVTLGDSSTILFKGGSHIDSSFFA